MTDQPININSAGLNIRNVILAAGATILITLVLMALASLSGGFVSGAETPNARPRMSLPIMIHLSTVIPAIPLGAFVLWRKKGDDGHKRLGRIWAVLMLVTALSSFWIGRPGTGIAGSGFSFIHGFAIWTLLSVPYAVYKVRKGNVEAHLRAMQGLYMGLLIAGLFSFIPGRIMGSLVFG